MTSSVTARPSVRLDRLPAELIAEICKTFCHHCVLRDEQGLRVPTGPPETPNHAATIALAHVSLTCTRLNAIATPYLYHRPIFTKWWLLTRTLIARPDLALHVHFLFDSMSGRPFLSPLANAFSLTASRSAPPFPPEVARHFTDSQLSRAMMLTEDETESTTTVGSAELRMWEVAESVGMLVSLCPNLEELAAVIDLPTIFKWNPLGSLARLKHVNLDQCNYETSLSLELLCQLATVAPNLVHFSCDNVVQNARNLPIIPTFSNLVKLRFKDTALCAEALSALLAACPNLQSFTYHARPPFWDEVPAVQFTPRQAQEIVTRFAPDLRSLALDLSPVNRWTDPVPDTFQSLTGLSKLEYLTLDHGCLLSHVNKLLARDPQPIPDPSPMLLVDLLPASVRGLSLTCHRIDDNADTVRYLSKSLLELTSASPKSFPQLECIKVSDFDILL